MTATYPLDPARSISQYVHSEWGKDKGFLGGTVYTICESGDGYLWLGTDRGLVRFDGERFTLIQHPIPDQPLIGAVRGLVEDADGSMWIRPQLPQILVYRNGQFKNAFASGGMPLTTTTAMAADGRGGVLFAGFGYPAIRYAHGQFEIVAKSGAATGTTISIAETQDGKIWLGTRDDGLLSVENGNSERARNANLKDDKINALAPENSGGLWVGTDQGLRFIPRERETRINAPEWNKSSQVIGVIRDMSGNVWAAGSRGLIRVTPHGTFTLLPGHSKKTPSVTAIYEDRAGNIWYGGPDGLERLQDGLFATYSPRDGIPSAHGGAIYADSARRTWFAPESGGLFFLKDGTLHRVRVEDPDHDLVYSISGTANEIWVGRQRRGLTRFTFDGDTISSKTFTHADGLAQNTVFSTYVSHDGTVWAGTISAGLSRFKDDAFTTYSTSNGLSSNAVNSVLEGSDGTLWVGTSAGLDAFTNGHWSHATMADGTPSPEVRYCFEDSLHVLWVITSTGIAHLSSGQLVSPSRIPDALRDQIFGVTEDGHGFFWLYMTDHILRVSRDKLFADELRENDLQLLGEEDGLIGAEGIRRDHAIVIGPDGNIWLSVQDGIASADPSLAVRRARSLPVRIEAVLAGGRTYDPAASPRIPAGTHSITIHYSGASPDSPNRFWYRYRLEGIDQAWSDPVQMRQVTYNNLDSRSYRFQVSASRDGILWNGTEGDLTFSIDQQFWETAWFRVAAVLLIALTVAIVFRLRTLGVSRQLTARFQERLAERTRLAVELHDTILQSIQATKMIADNAQQMNSHDPGELRKTIAEISDWLAQATTEARAALNGLRQSTTEKNDLARAFQQAVESIGIGASMNFSLSVQGTPRDLHPIVRDEIYRIGSEALRNASRHSGAADLQMDLIYARDLTVRVSDDGKGMDAAITISGKPGHFGLRGMQERASRIHAKLRVTSRLGSGTEVELLVPGKVVYKDADGGSRLFLLRLTAAFRRRPPSSA